MQRRPSATIIDELVRDYVAGSSIDFLAERLHVHRTTIISRLDRCIKRRRNVRKMTDRSVRQAAKRYASGESLKVVAIHFDVDARTLAGEFKRGGIEIRTRRGRHPHT